MGAGGGSPPAWGKGGLQRGLRANRGESEVQLLEDAVGDVADDEHDGLPLERDVEVVCALVDGGDDARGDLIYIGELLRALPAGRHGRLHRAGFGGEQGAAFGVDAVTQAGKERGEASFRRAVEIVRLAPAVA